MEVKVYLIDINEQYEAQYKSEKFYGKKKSPVTIQSRDLIKDDDTDTDGRKVIHPPIFTTGQTVYLIVSDYVSYRYNTSRDRWVFHMYPM